MSILDAVVMVKRKCLFCGHKFSGAACEPDWRLCKTCVKSIEKIETKVLPALWNYQTDIIKVGKICIVEETNKMLLKEATRVTGYLSPMKSVNYRR